MNYEQYQYLIANMFGSLDGVGLPGCKHEQVAPDSLPPLVLAYVGDAFFTLYIRTNLLNFEHNKVRVLHTFDAQMVSAPMQAAAYKLLEPSLSEAELSIVKRGRNAKSSVPKSATVSEYRYSTGFEALIGYLYLKGDYERLLDISGQAFVAISREMIDKQKSGDKK